MNAFTYSRAADAKGAIQDLAKGKQAKFLGGGTNLIDLMKMGVEAPTKLVDIRRLPLQDVTELPDGKGVRIGATATNSAIAEHPLIVANYPVLSEAFLSGASPQLRNMATVGGNLLQRTRCFYFYDPALGACNKRNPGSGCSAIDGFNRIHAILGHSPKCIATNPSDMNVALAALEAVVKVQGPKGERAIPFADFHRLPGDTPEVETNLANDELIVSVELPALPWLKKSHYLKMRDRASYAFALVSAGVALNIVDGKIQDARVALGGVAHKPWRSKEAEESLRGASPEESAFQKAAEAALKNAQAFSHNTFKIELAKRTIVEALATVANLA